MSDWWTDPADGPSGIRRHRKTGAVNMREHRAAKRVQADTRNATTQPENRSRKAAWADLKKSDRAGTVAPTPLSRKRSRQKRRKSEERLAAAQRATREWLDRDGPGVDF